MSVLNEIMSDIDEKCDEFGVEKIKTIGPTYMAMAGGLPSDVPGSPLVRMCRFAFEIKKIIARNNEVLNANFEIRIGLNVGPVVTGVIGTQKVRIWSKKPFFNFSHSCVNSLHSMCGATLSIRPAEWTTLVFPVGSRSPRRSKR